MTLLPQLRPAGRDERGAALLVVMVAVALLTAAAVDLAYQARVNLQIAGNARDELKAEAQARGALAMARLVLHFQGQVDRAAGNLSGGLAGLPGAAGLAGGLPRPQLWKLVPVDDFLTANLFPDAAPAGEGAAAGAGAKPGFDRPDRPDRPARPGTSGASGDGEGLPGAPPRPAATGAEGSFHASIEDEDRKVNAQLDGGSGALQAAQLDSFLAMVADRKWDFLFDHEDADGQRTSRTDLAVHLVDWVDQDQVQAAVTGNPNKPFESGFGDENFAYDRKADRYKAKNDRFDSLAELYLVTGVSDPFMAAFGERLTVYLRRDAKMNVNTDDPGELLRNARIMADPPQQPILYDQGFPDRLQKAVKLVRLGGGFLPMSPAQFAGVLQSLGLTVKSACTQTTSVDQKCAFTDRSQVFHVRASGRAGDVQKTIDAVVTFDEVQARDQATQLGRLLHWQQE